MRAERALQPGSGTTDLVLGLAWRRMLSATDALNPQATWNPTAQLARAVQAGAPHRAGGRLGPRVNPTVSAALQASVVDKARDSGDQAEPENSGSTFVSLSPGINVAIGASSVLYGYVQVPVYQRVNGIQLVPRTSFALGYTASF